jgi:glyoxylase-like metal-dependent hydrolase (beta-lactamase superfamily II)
MRERADCRASTTIHYDRDVRALRPGLWHWTASHPDWRPSEPWGQNVSSYAIDDGERLLLVDPIAPPSRIEKLATERETAVVLTAPWHERDTQRLVEQLGVPVYTPLPDTAEYLMQTYGATAEEAGDGSPDVVWLLKEGKGEAHPYAAGDRLDVGVDVFPGQKPNDTVLWIESHRAVVAGDTLVDFGNGLEISERWLQLQRATREQVVEGLRPLLQLPVEHVLATHGGPSERAALERALSLVRRPAPSD